MGFVIPLENPSGTGRHQAGAGWAGRWAALEAWLRVGCRCMLPAQHRLPVGEAARGCVCSAAVSRPGGGQVMMMMGACFLLQPHCQQPCARGPGRHTLQIHQYSVISSSIHLPFKSCQSLHVQTGCWTAAEGPTAQKQAVRERLFVHSGACSATSAYLIASASGIACGLKPA